MRANEFLIEYDRTKTAATLGDKLIHVAYEDNTYRTYRSGITPSDILEKIETKDPTPNKEYTQWLARMYAKGGVPFEDLNRMDVLSSYNIGKKRRQIQPEDADINKFKTYKEFEDTMMSKYSQLNTDPKEVNKGKSTLYFEDDNVRIIIPEDEAAACYYGRGTRWCTAATKGENYFNHYNTKGKIYIILFKKFPNKWQFHFETAQFMDEADNELGIEQVRSVSHYFSKKIWNDAFINRPAEMLKYIKNPTEKQKIAAVTDSALLALEYIKNPSNAVKLAAITSDPEIIQYIENPTEQMQLVAVESDGYLIRYIKNPSNAVMMAAVKTNPMSMKRYIYR